MKCKNCGGEIRLEDLVCPYCGSPNEEAQRHAEDMRRYQREFLKTRREVTERARHSSRMAVRIAAIALLIAAIGANIFLQANSYNIRYSLYRMNTRKNAAVHIARMEEYLDAEDYMGFASYCSSMQLSMAEDTFDRYYRVYRIASNYRNAAEQLMRAVNRDKFDSVDQLSKYVTDYIQEFYESLDPERYSYYDSYDDEEIQAHVDNMKASMEALCQAYLAMTSEEAESMSTLSRAGQATLIERGMQQYEEAENDE